MCGRSASPTPWTRAGRRGSEVAASRKKDEPSDGIAVRFLLWMVVAVALIALACYFRIAIPGQHVVEVFAAKLTLVGLAATVATFQYSGWHRTAREVLDQVHEPKWTASVRRLQTLRAKVESNTGSADDYLTLGIRVGQWQEWRLDAAGGMLRDLLPFNRRVLGDLLAGVYLLLLSSTGDLAGLVLDQHGTAWRWFSLGAFAASIPPFLGAWGAYLLSLSHEFRAWEIGFRGAEDEARAWLEREKGGSAK
jgi:hypothetical protein